MPFVLDCSVTMAWVFPDESSDATDALRDSLLEDTAVVPALWRIEVANVLLVATRRGRVREEDWGRIRDDLAALPIETDLIGTESVLDFVLPVAGSHDLSVYDAMYLGLALRRGLPIATLDRKLAAASESSGVQVLAQRRR